MVAGWRRFAVIFSRAWVGANGFFVAAVGHKA